MERAELVQRIRSTEDRRVVRVRITAKGRRLAESLYDPVEALHEAQLSHLGDAELTKLTAALRAALERP